MFEIGCRYRRQDGRIITIVANNYGDKFPRENKFPKGYECVQGDDISEETGEGIWRYNRPGRNELGRVCGTPHDWSDPRNLESVEIIME